MRMAVLGSGSGGNATLVRCGSTIILVDAGLSAKQLVLRMAALGVQPEQLDAILLTHEHSDHARGVDVLLRNLSIPVYANALTREALSYKMKSEIPWRIFRSGQSFDLGDLSIEAFKIPHDAAEPVGFTINGLNTKLGMLSDVGHVTQLIRDQLKESHAIYVEANYDEHLLEMDTKRPWSTKQRISSRHGHLSNKQTATLLNEVASKKLSHVMLCHLSSDCNCPELATKTISESLKNEGYDEVQVQCAEQDQPTKWVEFSGPQPKPAKTTKSTKTSKEFTPDLFDTF